MNKFILVSTILCLVALIESKREVKFAPYIYLEHGIDFVKLKNDAHLTGISLAFALGGSNCVPHWDAGSIDDKDLVKQFHAFKQAGGQIIVSSGGADGKYIENSCGGDSNRLAAAYKRVIEVTGAVGLDLDFEETVNLDMVMAAVKIVQQQTGVTVSLTLGADENGLGGTQMNVVRAAIKHGVDVDIVNPMAMDYNKSSKYRTWGDSVIGCVEAVHRQMKQELWPGKSDAELYSRLGVTPMIGENDCCNAKFTTDHARQLLQWAKQKGLGHIGFWSVNRDHQCHGSESQTNAPSDKCSGVPQQNYEFSHIFDML
ncbi:chitinase-like [Oppia nitens]|uniref:chitinase-like n=1 Tax=Oppia nitens TaxID=1686743 RepID=UPI0023D9A759|nr:chitinase-like [Oppia nitens]